MNTTIIDGGCISCCAGEAHIEVRIDDVAYDAACAAQGDDVEVRLDDGRVIEGGYIVDVARDQRGVAIVCTGSIA